MADFIASLKPIRHQSDIELERSIRKCRHMIHDWRAIENGFDTSRAREYALLCEREQLRRNLARRDRRDLLAFLIITLSAFALIIYHFPT